MDSIDDVMSCPRCGVTKQRKPNLKLLVNVCGHALCDTCVDLLFSRGGTGECPTCGHTQLRRQNFKLQVFEDGLVQREIEIRRQILRDFNKREGDFPDLSSYNDYLEMVESIIYNLANNLEVEATKLQVEQYVKENREQIKRNVNKQTRDQEEVERLLVEERVAQQERRKTWAEADREEREEKRVREEKILAELEAVDDVVEAGLLLSRYREVAAGSSMIGVQPPSTFSSGIRIGGVGGAAGGGLVDEAKPYQHHRILHTNPPLPHIHRDFDKSLVDEWMGLARSSLPPGHLAGGFMASYLVERNMEIFSTSLHMLGGRGWSGPPRVPPARLFTYDYSMDDTSTTITIQ